MRAAIPEELLFKGRPEDPRLGEWVQRINSPRGIAKEEHETVVIMGCADDQGVILNRGRGGADEGPNSIRKHLYRMTLPMDSQWESSLALFDMGNILPASDILETHDRARRVAREITSNGALLITLGGGHDFAAPTFSGFAEGLKEFTSKEAKVALINVDPHLDVRKLEHERPHSGTPFRQLLDSKVLSGRRFVEFGIRANRNSRDSLEYCRSQEVTVVTLEDALIHRTGPVSLFVKYFNSLSKTASHVGVTFDMDCCSDAEGTSAAPVMGFSARELCAMAEIAGRDKKVGFLELAEVAPSLDATDRSSRIASEIIYSFLRGRASQSGRRSGSKK